MKNKIVTGLFLAVLACVCLSGCTYESMNTETSPNPSVQYFTDEETGVEYLLYSGVECVAICPRYNADGTFYTEAENK